MSLGNVLAMPRREISRRRLMAAVAGIALTQNVTSCASGTTNAAFRFDEAIVLDALGAFSDPDPSVAEDDPPSVLLMDLRRRAGLTAMSTTIGTPGAGADRFAEAMANLDALRNWLHANPEHFTLILSADDLWAAKRAGQLGVICNLQDTTALGEDLSRVSVLKQAGLRVLQLTYNRENSVGFGCLAPSDHGLTALGRDAVAAINEARLLLDASHAGPRTTMEAIEASRLPCAISHTGCRALVDFPRNVTDEALRALADRGGVVGIYFMPFLCAAGVANSADVVRHLEHAIDVCGEDHVGIGTDGGLPAIDDRGRELHRQTHEARLARGFAAPGEGSDRFNYVEEYNTPDRFRILADDLAVRGWSARRIEKVLGGNFARLFGEAWGG